MSETEKPRQDPDREQESGAEAPAQPEQPQQAEQAAQAPPAQQETPPAQPAPPPPPPPAPRRVPSTVRTWVAAVVAGVLLLGGGLGGYFIGAANGHDRDRPGISRNGDHWPGEFRDGPRFRQER